MTEAPAVARDEPASVERASPLLAIESLSVGFPSADGWVEVVREASLTVGRGEIVGLVGESGSGKTMTAMAVLRLVPEPGRILGGRIAVAGTDVLALDERALRRLRGGTVGMVFQEPAAALDPVFTVGAQIVETIRAHRDVSRRAARARAEELLELVAIPEPRRRLDDYPHQLSGGQRQRVMIALSLAAEPALLLADEPTTALDVTLQKQVLELLLRLRDELGLGILLVTHDLAVVAETCDRVVVMYCGEVVEEATTRALFAAPAHPYTRGLLAAVPRLGHPAPRGQMPAIPGQVPDPRRRPSGCAFHPRCAWVMPVCPQRRPEMYVARVGMEARVEGAVARDAVTGGGKPRPYDQNEPPAPEGGNCRSRSPSRSPTDKQNELPAPDVGAGLAPARSVPRPQIARCFLHDPEVVAAPPAMDPP